MEIVIFAIICESIFCQSKKSGITLPILICQHTGRCFPGSGTGRVGVLECWSVGGLEGWGRDGSGRVELGFYIEGTNPLTR